MEASKQEQKFEFVVSTPSHNALEQKDTQTLVRQHVMRRYKRKENRSKVTQLQGDALAEYLAQRHLHENTGSAALLGASRPNPFGRYPIDMGTAEHELVHHIWGSHQSVFQPFRDYWFLLGMMDPAAMHLIIANGAIHRKSLRSIHEDDILDLTHCNNAIRSINKRMAVFEQSVTNEMLGAVLGLMCHDLLAGSLHNCSIHLKGFQKMVELRGGTSTIDHIHSVRMSVYWIEHNICAALDMIPLFPPPFHLITSPYTEAARSLGLRHQEDALRFAGITELLSPQLQNVLTGVSTLVVAWSDQTLLYTSLQDPNFPGFAFYPELHSLFSLQRVVDEDARRQAVQELCRLAATLFLAEVRKTLAIQPIMTNVQTGKLRILLEEHEVLWDSKFDSIRVWTLVIAGCTTVDSEVREWVRNNLRDRRSSKRNLSWDLIQETMSKMWWIEEVFAPKAEQMRHVYERVAEIA